MISTFPLNGLPYSLMTMIFEYSSARELLKFLKINWQLRDYALGNGPFQKKLLKVSIKLFTDYDTVSSHGDDELLVKYGKIILYTLDDHEFCFTLQERRQYWTRNVIDEKREMIRMLPGESRLLLDRLPFCRRVSMKVAKRVKWMPVCLIRPITNYLPRLGGRPIEELYLSCQYQQQATSILNNIHTKVSSRLEYWGLDQRFLEDEIRVLDDPFYNQFIDENLVDCFRIDLTSTRFAISRLEVEPNLAKTNSPIIQIHLKDANDFRDSLKSIIDHGIPSWRRSAELEISTILPVNEEDLVLQDPSTDLKLSLELIAEAVVSSSESEEILSKFLRVSKIRRLLNNEQLFEYTFYKRRFSETLDYFYITCQLGRNTYVFVKSERHSEA